MIQELKVHCEFCFNNYYIFIPLFFCGKVFLFFPFISRVLFSLVIIPLPSLVCVSHEPFFHLSFLPHYFPLTRLLVGICLLPPPFWSLHLCSLAGSAPANRMCYHRDCQCQQHTKNSILERTLAWPFHGHFLTGSSPSPWVELEL